MTQIQVRANLLATDFALVSKFQGRTVLINRYDQRTPASDGSSTTGRDNDAQPEVYYMHNVLPTIHGYKSVAYKEVVQHLTGVIFTTIVPFRGVGGTSDQDRGYLGFTTDGRTFMVSTLNGYWVDITPPGQPITGPHGPTEITTATVLGITYICYSDFGIFTVNMTTQAMVVTNLTGITENLIRGISASNNYLLLHDGEIVYWSSALDPLDFVPSLITGAGSGTPASTGGAIVLISPLSTGFAIYTTTNIIISLYSGNTRFPWIFKEANNSSGIANVTAVASAGDDGSNYAWTSAGLLKVTLSGAAPVLPDVTDFISGNIIEDYDPVTKKLTVTPITGKLYVQLSYSSARYVIVSYGRKQYEMDYAIVYDLALKRVGKLKISHAAPLEFIMDYADGGITYAQSATTTDYITFTASAGLTIAQSTILSDTPADAKHTTAFMSTSGGIFLAISDYANYTSDAVILLGKYQLVRNNLVSVQGVTVETIDAINSNFSVSDIVTYGGAIYQDATQMFQIGNGDTRQYLARLTGVNHSFLIEGAFNLVSFVINFSVHGRA